MSCYFRDHVPERGWAKGLPYFRIKEKIIDGIGREHAYLEATCRRCGEKYIVGAVHLPNSRTVGNHE